MYKTFIQLTQKVKKLGFKHLPVYFETPCIFVYYSWAASYMRQPIYVGFNKTVSNTTIEQNFDERTASGI